MALTFTVDGWSSTNLDLIVRSADDRRLFPTRTYPTARVPHRAQRILLDGENAVRGSRMLEIVCRLNTGNDDILLGTDGGDTLVTDSGDALLARTADEEFAVQRDELIGRASHGEVAISFSDQTGREFRGRLSEETHQMLTRAKPRWDELVLGFDLLDPFERSDSTITLSGIGSNAQDVAIGTAPVEDFTLTLDGPFTDPTITYKDHTGTTQKSMSFTLTKGSSGSLTIDMDAGTIVDEGGTSQIDALDTGSDFPFRIHPRDAEHWNANWPTLETSDGALSISYDKAWS